MRPLFLILLVLGCTLTTKSEEVLKTAFEAEWKGKKVCELLFEDEKIRTIKCTFPPGVGHEKHYHPPHFGYILKGGPMRITDSSGVRESGTVAGSGKTWQSKGVEWHHVINMGTTTTQYLITELKY